MMSTYHFLLCAAVMTTIICKKTREVDDDLSSLMECCGDWRVPSHQQRRSKVSFWTPTFTRKQETIQVDFDELFNIMLTGLLSFGVIYGIFRIVEISPEIRHQRVFHRSFYLRMTLWDELRIPGPPCESLFGHLRLINSQGGLRQSVNRWLVKYGPIFGIYIGRQPVLVVADCEMVSEILRNGSGCFGDRSDIPKVLCEPPLRGNLFSASEIAWESLHFNHSSTFSTTNLKYMVHRLNRCAMILAEYMEDEAVSRLLKVNIEELMTSYVYDCMAALILGQETDHREDSNDAFFKAVKAALDSSTLDYGGVAVPDTVRELESYISDVIEERRVQNSHMTRLDYVDIMMNAGSHKDNFRISLPSMEMGDEQITATMLFWVLHGHATLLSALQFVVYLLAENPNHQETVLKEVQNVIGNEDPTFEDLMQLPFLDKVIDESLRLFSPVQEIWRRVNDEIHIRNIHFPKDSSVLIPVQALHFNQNYFPNPHLFLPDRWKKTGDVRLREHRSEAFIPFGEGSRACVGQKLSLLQIKLALVHCIRRVQFLTTNDEYDSSHTYNYAERQMIARLAVTKTGTLRPYKGVYVRLRPRAPENVILSPEENRHISLVSFEESLDKEADMLTEKTKGEYFYNISDENSDVELDDNKARKRKSLFTKGDGIKPGMTRESTKANKRGHASKQLETDFVTDDEDDQAESSFKSSDKDFQAKSHRVKYEDHNSDETIPLSDDTDDTLKSDTKPSGSKKKSKQKAKDSESPLKSDSKPSGSKSRSKKKAKAESDEKVKDSESTVKSDSKPSGSKSRSKKKAKAESDEKVEDPESSLKSDTKPSSKSRSKHKKKAEGVDKDNDSDSSLKPDTKPSGSKSRSKKKAKAEGVKEDEDPESPSIPDTDKAQLNYANTSENADKDNDPESPSKPDTDKSHLELNSSYIATTKSADKCKDPEPSLKCHTKPSGSKSSSKHKAKAESINKNKDSKSPLESYTEDAYLELNSNYKTATENADKDMDPESPLESYTEDAYLELNSNYKTATENADKDMDPESPLESYTEDAYLALNSNYKTATENADKDMDPESPLKSYTEDAYLALNSNYKTATENADKDMDPESPLESYTEDAYLELNSNYKTATENADKDMDPESPLKSDTKHSGAKSSSKIKAKTEGADKDKDPELSLKSDTKPFGSKSSSKFKAKTKGADKDKDPELSLKSDTKHSGAKSSSKIKAKTKGADKDKDPKSPLKSYTEDAYLKLNSNYKIATENADKDMDPESPPKSVTKPSGSKSSSKNKAIPEGADKDKDDTELSNSKLSSKHEAKDESVDKDIDPKSLFKSYTEDAYVELNSNYKTATENADKLGDPESPLKSETEPSGSKSSSKNRAIPEGADKDKDGTEPSSSKLTSKQKSNIEGADKDKDPELFLKSDTESSSSKSSSKHKAKIESVNKDKDPQSLMKAYIDYAYLVLNSNYKAVTENADKDMDPESPLESYTEDAYLVLNSNYKAVTENADEDKDPESPLKSGSKSSCSKSSSKRKSKTERVDKDKDPKSPLKSNTKAPFSNSQAKVDSTENAKDSNSILKSENKKSHSKLRSKRRVKAKVVESGKEPDASLKSETEDPYSMAHLKSQSKWRAETESVENGMNTNSPLKSNDSQSKPCLNQQTITDSFGDSNESPLSQTVGLTQFSRTLKTIVETSTELAFTYKPFGVAITTDSGSLDPFNTGSTGFYVNESDCSEEEKSQNNTYTGNEPNESGYNIDILTGEKSQNNTYTGNEPNESGYNIDILTEENISTYSINVGTPFIGPSLHEVPSLSHSTDQGLSDFSTNSKVSEFPGSALKKEQETFQQGQFKTDVSPKKCTQKDSVASKESQYWSCQTSLENSAVAVKGDNYLQSQSNVGIPSTFKHSESMQRQVSPPGKMEMKANTENIYAECSAALNQRLNYVSQDSKSQPAHLNAHSQLALAPGKSYFEQTHLASHPVLEIQSKNYLQSLPKRDSQPKAHQSTSALLNEVKARLICSEQTPTAQVTRYLQIEKDESRNQSLPNKRTDRKLMHEALRNLLPVQSVGTESDILVTSKPKPYARESNSHNSRSLSWQRERTSPHFPTESAPILSHEWEEDSAFRSVQMDHSKNNLEDENIFTVSWSDNENSSLFQTPDVSPEASFIEVEASFSASGTDSDNCLQWIQDRICFEDEVTLSSSTSDEEIESLFTNIINSCKSRFTEENTSKAYRRSQRRLESPWTHTRNVNMLRSMFAPITSAFHLLLDSLHDVITRFTNKTATEKTKVRPYLPRDQFDDNFLITVKNKPPTPIGSVAKPDLQGNWPVCKRCVPDSADFASQSQIICTRTVYKTPKMNEQDLVKELLDKCISDIQLSSAEESSLVPQYTHTKRIVTQLADFYRSVLDPERRELVEIQSHDTGKRVMERNVSGWESNVESVYTDDILGDADVPTTSSKKPILKQKKVQGKKGKTSSEAGSENFGKSKRNKRKAPMVEEKPKHFPAQNSDIGKSMRFVKSEANSLRHPRTFVENSLRSLARTARDVIPIVLLAPLTPFIDMFLSLGSLSQEGASADTKAEERKGKSKTADVDSFERNNSHFGAARHCRTRGKVSILSDITDQDISVMTTSSHESDSDEVEEEEFRLNLSERRPLIFDFGASCSTLEDDQPCSFQNSRQTETYSSPDSVRSKYNNLQCGSMEDFDINKPKGEFILHKLETPSISVVAASPRRCKSEIHEDINENSSKDGYASRNKESNIGKSLSMIFTSHSSSIDSLSLDVRISYSNNILPVSRDSGTLHSSSMTLLFQDVQEINSYQPLNQAKTNSYGNFSRSRSENDFQKIKNRSPWREDGTSHYCSAPYLLSLETGFLDCDKFDGNNRSEEFDLTETALPPTKTLEVGETVFIRSLSKRGRGFYDCFDKSKSVKEFCFQRKEKLPSPWDFGTRYYTKSQTENGSFRTAHSDHKVYLKKTKKRQLVRETFSAEDYGARPSVPIRDVMANIFSKSLAQSAASIFISRSQNTSQESIPWQVTRLDKESTVYYGARSGDETSESGVYEEMKEGAIPEEDWQPTPIHSTTGISRLEETSSEWGQKSGQQTDTFRLEKNDKPASPEANTSTSDKKSKQN